MRDSLKRGDGLRKSLSVGLSGYYRAITLSMLEKIPAR